jgi:hypothetical protein
VSSCARTANEKEESNKRLKEEAMWDAVKTVIV